MTDEFVTRAMFDAMVAERDALAARVATAGMTAAERERLASIRASVVCYRGTKGDMFTVAEMDFVLRLVDKIPLSAALDAATAPKPSAAMYDALAQQLADLREIHAAAQLGNAATIGRLTEERDALAVHLTDVSAIQSGNQKTIGQLREERDRLTASLAAAHGLQSRAERAEAALRGLLMICGETHSESVYDSLEEIKRARKCLPDEDTSWRAALAAVPS